MYITMKTPWVRVHTWDPADEIRESKYTTEHPNLNCPAPTEGHRSSALPLREPSCKGDALELCSSVWGGWKSTQTPLHRIPS